MPLDRAHRLTDQSVEMHTADDIHSVFEALRRIPDRGFFTQERAQREIAEEIGYQLLVNRDWIRPHVARLVREGVAAAMSFEWRCLLMDDAPNELLEELTSTAGAGGPPARDAIDLLLASRQRDALEAVDKQAARDAAIARRCRDLGFDRTAVGGLTPRFSIERAALRLVPGTVSSGARHAVGLPLGEVVQPAESQITFHYLSVTPGAFPPLPSWRGQAHLVAPRSWPDWTLYGDPDDAGRLRVIKLELEDDRSLDAELAETLDEAAEAEQPSAAVEVAALDDALIYANQHALTTPNIIGMLGGPPMGLAPAPVCPTCGRVMFHIGWMDTHAREYGDGFRSLFVCEDCRLSATVATLWN